MYKRQVTEGVWDNRFKYVDELHRMGAKIQVDGKVAVVAVSYTHLDVYKRQQ